MKNSEISRQIQSLEALMKTALASTQNVELRSHWARYFCVRVAGILENSIYEIYSEYVTKKSLRQISNYASSRLKTIHNPNAEQFIKVAGSFDRHWGQELEKYLGENGRKDALDSIMNVRHQIAHGKDADITAVRITDYLKKAIEVLEFIETQVSV